MFPFFSNYTKLKTCTIHIPIYYSLTQDCSNFVTTVFKSPEEFNLCSRVIHLLFYESAPCGTLLLGT